jgi:hypothetical protein
MQKTFGHKRHISIFLLKNIVLTIWAFANDTRLEKLRTKKMSYSTTNLSTKKSANCRKQDMMIKCSWDHSGHIGWIVLGSQAMRHMPELSGFKSQNFIRF